MKMAIFQVQRLSFEKIDLLSTLNHKSFYSPSHGALIKIQDDLILQNSKVIDHIVTDEQAEFMFAEFQYQLELSEKSNEQQ